jgi:hypothetical protein
MGNNLRAKTSRTFSPKKEKQTENRKYISNDPVLLQWHETEAKPTQIGTLGQLKMTRTEMRRDFLCKTYFSLFVSGGVV